MYFISRVRFPTVEAPLISVRRPGLVPDKGWTELNAASSARTINSKHNTRTQRIRERRRW